VVRASDAYRSINLEHAMRILARWKVELIGYENTRNSIN